MCSQSSIGGYLLEIDQLYKYMYDAKILPRSFLLDPRTTNEAICKQVNESEIKSAGEVTFSSPQTLKIYDATVTDLSDGLKFIYFNLKQSESRLHEMEAELGRETVDTLVQVSLADMTVNSYYIVRYNKKLSRCMLLSREKESCQVQMLDSGCRVVISDKEKIKFFAMMCKYFKFGVFALHCRLPFASSIEKVWLKVS